MFPFFDFQNLDLNSIFCSGTDEAQESWTVVTNRLVSYLLNVLIVLLQAVQPAEAILCHPIF
jgi:hypothetical protein